MALPLSMGGRRDRAGRGARVGPNGPSSLSVTTWGGAPLPLAQSARPRLWRNDALLRRVRPQPAQPFPQNRDPAKKTGAASAFILKGRHLARIQDAQHGAESAFGRPFFPGEKSLTAF